MNRIETIVSNINDSDLVADIGCDQVEVGIMLAKKGIKSIGSDISENVINKAKEKINELELNDYIDLRVSDGLYSIKENEVNTLVLAGMGTHTILDILSNTNLRFNKIITISNNHHELLRSSMNNLNYKVSSETIIKDKNKYYNLIVFVPGNKEYTKEELLLGYNHTDKVMFNEYKKYLSNKYHKIIESSNDKNNKINEIIKILDA